MPAEEEAEAAAEEEAVTKGDMEEEVDVITGQTHLRFLVSREK